MKRHVIAALSSLAIAAALAGCGGTDEPATAGGSSAPAPTETSTTVAPAATSTATRAATPNLRATAERAARAGSVAELEPFMTKACALYMRELGAGTVLSSTVVEVEQTGDTGVVVNVDTDGDRSVNKWVLVDGDWQWSCDTQSLEFDTE
ncbi:hypothetical protein SEA_NANCYRAE_38 [Gordonia phage NancyRae]|uniref:Lipoprotein n=1 Tax=Gordonia phage NancyRae TaxID=2793698 RepID=A0A7T0Q3J4_9CAUD|nr:hypothetical protein SEA_NANCYRAE_38 [Gordonia phage NancyRae]